MAADAIGFTSGVLGIAGTGAIDVISGLKDALFPEPPSTAFNNFQLRVGIVKPETGNDRDEQSGTRSLGGNAPALITFDTIGRYLHFSNPKTEKIQEDVVRAYQIEGPGEADYLSVVRTGNDGICISYISGTTNGGLEFFWTGDIGMICGAPWYPSTNAIGQDADEFSYFPRCIWIDGNADDDHIWRGFNFHLGSFPGSASDPVTIDRARDLAKSWNENQDLICKSEPRFSMYEDIEIGNSIRYFLTDVSGPSNDSGVIDRVLNSNNWDWSKKIPHTDLPRKNTGNTGDPIIICVDGDICPPEGPSFDRNLPVLPDPTKPQRRSPRYHEEQQATTIKRIKKRQVIHADRLIITSHSSHSAVELCDSPFSLGPDMVSTVENMFCDMSEKQLWPVCTDATTAYCFDMESQTVRGPGPSSSNHVPTPLWSNGFSNSSSLAVSLVAGNPTVPAKSYATVDSWGT